MGCCHTKESAQFDKNELEILTEGGEIEQPFMYNIIPAKIIRIVDGDTIEVCIINVRHRVKYRVRLANINAHELHPRNNSPLLQTHTKEYIKQKAEYTTRVLSNILSNGWCVLRTFGMDNFGRIIAVVYDTEFLNVNKYLLEHPSCDVQMFMYDGVRFSLSESEEFEIGIYINQIKSILN